MRTVPVLDLREGRAVHARRGDRAHYGPLRSVLHEGANPRDLARALVERGGRTLYLADLDAIEGRKGPDLALFQDLSALGLSLWVDAGLRLAEDAGALDHAGVTTIVAGLETLEGPGELGRLVDRFTTDRVVFSLDLRDGQPLGGLRPPWRTERADVLATIAFDQGVSRLLILDLGLVGTGEATRSLGLLEALRRAAPSKTELAVGGGVGGPEDLRLLREAGADVVLVGSAFHNGRVDLVDPAP